MQPICEDLQPKADKSFIMVSALKGQFEAEVAVSAWRLCGLL